MSKDEEEEFVFRCERIEVFFFFPFSSDRYSPEFIAKLREKFKERYNRQNTGQNASTEDSVGILGKITAGLQSVSETINDIVRKNKG